MKIKFEIIHATCEGIKDPPKPNQDYLIIDEGNDYLIATVSDGLGSSVNSEEGAEVACKVVVDYFKSSFQNFGTVPLKTAIPDSWDKVISTRPGKRNDYRTANSFVVVLKNEKRMILGRLGDVLIRFKIDGVLMPLLGHVKEFLNETECLGSDGKQEYEISFHEYKNTLEFLIASDGLGDELISDKVEMLFTYLKTKFGAIKRKQRNTLLKKEMEQTLKDKNNDDKSIIFVWTN